MTKERILELAYERQRQIWGKCYDMKKLCPDVKKNADDEAEEWERLLEIERMLQKEMCGAERV